MKSQYGSPSQAAAPALEYVGVGRRLLALIIDGFILLIVGWIIAVAFPSSGVITRGDDAWDRFKWKTFVSSVVISTPLTKTETIVVFVTFAIANISAEEVQLCPIMESATGSNSATIASLS